MPWNVFPDEQGQFCVYKIDDEGDQTGKSLGCHDDEESAKDQVKALYANVAHSIIRNARLIIDSLPKKPTLQYQALETLSKMRSVRVVLRGGEGSGILGHTPENDVQPKGEGGGGSDKPNPTIRKDMTDADIDARIAMKSPVMTLSGHLEGRLKERIDTDMSARMRELRKNYHPQDTNRIGVAKELGKKYKVPFQDILAEYTPDGNINTTVWDNRGNLASYKSIYGS